MGGGIVGGGGGAGGGGDSAFFLHTTEDDPTRDVSGMFNSITVGADGFMTIDFDGAGVDHGTGIRDGMIFDLGDLRDHTGAAFTPLGNGACLYGEIEIRNKANARGVVASLLWAVEDDLASDLAIGGNVYIEANTNEPVYGQIRHRNALPAGTGSHTSGKRLQVILSNGATSVSNAHVNLFDDADPAVIDEAAEHAVGQTGAGSLAHMLLVISQIGTYTSNRVLEIRCRSMSITGPRRFDDS
jgi:hypothetical protein